MKKIIYIVLLILITTAPNYSQYPDTILVKTERMKGFGTFQRGLSFAKTMGSNNPWRNSIPDIKGIPNDLENMMFAVVQTDFMQHTFQQHYSNKIDDERFAELRKSWNWNPSEKEYSKEFVKVDLVIVAGYDKNGLLKIKVDKNNNYDLSDDKYFMLPNKIPGQNFWGRYNDLLPFEFTYEYFDGSNIRKEKAFLYIDYSPFQYNSDEEKSNPIELSYAFAEYHLGELLYNNTKYFVAVKSDRVTFRDNYKLKIWTKETQKENSKLPGISRNGFVKIEDYYYRFDKVSVNGDKITLIKDRSILEKGGNQVGFKAINFVSKTIKGNIIELSKLKGNVVLLDFWGTWCSPCREEIPKLKVIYEEYKDKDFKLIGIANDDIKSLNDFIVKNEIEWEQIIQSNDKQLINDYGVVGYPTTFLIDKEGKIVAKGLRAHELSKKLKEMLH